MSTSAEAPASSASSRVSSSLCIVSTTMPRRRSSRAARTSDRPLPSGIETSTTRTCDRALRQEHVGAFGEFDACADHGQVRLAVDHAGRRVAHQGVVVDETP